MKKYIIILLTTVVFMQAFLSVINLYDLKRLSQDRFAFWSSSLAFNQKLNPYNPTLVLENAYSQESFRKDDDMDLELVWAPPIVFSFISWFSKSSFDQFRVHLLFAVLIIFISGIFISFKLYASPGNYLFILPALLTFDPFQFTPIGGPIVGFSFLGIGLFLLIHSCKPKRLGSLNVLSGICLSVSLIKPHLVGIIFLYILINSIKKRDFTIILGIIIGTMLMSLTSLFHFPEVWSLWFKNLGTFPITYWTPTIASWLTVIFDLSPNFKFLPFTICAVGYTFYLTRKKQEDFDTFSDSHLAIVLSILSAPYMWAYDFVLLWYPLCLGCSLLFVKDFKLTRYLIYSSVLILIYMLFLHSATYLQNVVWYPTLVTLFYLWMTRKRRFTSIA